MKKKTLRETMLERWPWDRSPAVQIAERARRLAELEAQR